MKNKMQIFRSKKSKPKDKFYTKKRKSKKPNKYKSYLFKIFFIFFILTLYIKSKIKEKEKLSNILKEKNITNITNVDNAIDIIKEEIFTNKKEIKINKTDRNIKSSNMSLNETKYFSCFVAKVKMENDILERQLSII